MRTSAGDPLPGAWIDLLGRASEGAYGDAGIRQYQAGLVIDQPTREVEGRGGVVVALVPVLVGGPCVLLLEAFHAQIQSSYVGGRRLRRRTGGEGKAVHRQGVGHRRGLQVHIQAAVQVGSRLSVDAPATFPIPLEQSPARPGGGASGHASAAGAPADVDPDLVVDDPGLSVLDRGRGADDQMTVVVGREVDDLEAGAGLLVSPGRARRRREKGHAVTLTSGAAIDRATGPRSSRPRLCRTRIRSLSCNSVRRDGGVRA